MNNGSQVLQIPIEDIIPNRFQPRLNFDDCALQELAASIKQHGVIQPLILRRLGDKYEIIAGERRYKASKMAGLTSVPGIVNEMDDQKSAEVAIVENIQRKDLSSIEEARSYKSLLDKGYLTQEELAKKMGISQSAVSNKLRLLSLSPEVQEALMENKISERHARSLLQITDLGEQKEWLNKIIEERLTVRDLEKKIKAKKTENGPILKINPDVNDIMNNATDLFNSNFKVPVVDNVVEHKTEPSKFFNSLENEGVNMQMSEPESSIAPVGNLNGEEEIEMLDFDIPTPKVDEKYTETINEIKTTLTNLNIKNNNITFIETDNGNNYQINITIKKEDN